MKKIEILGFGDIILKYIVLDFNGTLAIDGNLIEGVSDRIIQLAEHYEIHVITADNYGYASSQLKALPCKIKIINNTNEDKQKEDYIKSLGSHHVVAIGNGNNDRKMLTVARIGIAVTGEEGCATQTLLSSDIFVQNILTGLDLLLKPQRLKTTLRF